MCIRDSDNPVLAKPNTCKEVKALRSIVEMDALFDKFSVVRFVLELTSTELRLLLLAFNDCNAINPSIPVKPEIL